MIIAADLIRIILIVRFCCCCKIHLMNSLSLKTSFTEGRSMQKSG